jgi:hypothetical protein
METQQRVIRRSVLSINARAWGISTGLLLGVGLFLATNILVLRGGENVGQHLQLLSIYFPGYQVTFVGSIIGFVYAFVLGYGLGRIIGHVYNLSAGVAGRA